MRLKKNLSMLQHLLPKNFPNFFFVENKNVPNFFSMNLLTALVKTDGLQIHLTLSFPKQTISLKYNEKVILTRAEAWEFRLRGGEDEAFLVLEEEEEFCPQFSIRFSGNYDEMKLDLTPDEGEMISKQIQDAFFECKTLKTKNQVKSEDQEQLSKMFYIER